jgi:hypothetical protein
MIQVFLLSLALRELLGDKHLWAFVTGHKCRTSQCDY